MKCKIGVAKMNASVIDNGIRLIPVSFAAI